MRWHLGNVYTRCEDATEAEQGWLGEYLSYEERVFIPRTHRYVSRRKNLLNFLTGEFLTGFVPQAFVEAKRNGHFIQVIDGRVKPCAIDPHADLEWLRHHPAVTGEITHQIEAVEAAKKRPRGIIWAPTGSGKTDISIGIAKAMPCRFLFLVHKIDLLQQTANRYKLRTGLEAGVIGDGKVSIPDGCRFVVASFQTMHSAITGQRSDILDVLRNAEGLIIDEVHSLGAETYIGVVRNAVNAYYRYGMSGTPLARSDERNLFIIGGLGPVIYRVMPEQLIGIGLLARPRIRMLRVAQKADRATWRGVYTQAIARSDTRNRTIVAIVQAAGKPCLVFVQQVAHGRLLQRMLGQAGAKSEFVFGEEPLAVRQAAIKRLVYGDIEALVCSVIFQEGIDIPSLRSVVVATGGASTIAALQRIGRGMRADASTGKTEFDVIDLYDVGCGCRPNSSDGQHSGCKWLERHSKARKRAYEDEGFTVETVEVVGIASQQELDLAR